jgi:hypothetical protein
MECNGNNISNRNDIDANSAFRQALGRARAWRAYIRMLVTALMLRQARLAAKAAEVGSK